MSNNWADIPCSLIRRLSIVSRLTLQKQICFSPTLWQSFSPWCQHPIWMPAGVQAAYKRFRPQPTCLGKQQTGPVWAPVSCGRLKQAPGSWFPPGTFLIIVDIWGENHQLVSLPPCLSASLSLSAI